MSSLPSDRDTLTSPDPSVASRLLSTLEQGMSKVLLMVPAPPVSKDTYTSRSLVRDLSKLVTDEATRTAYDELKTASMAGFQTRIYTNGELQQIHIVPPVNVEAVTEAIRVLQEHISQASANEQTPVTSAEPATSAEKLRKISYLFGCETEPLSQEFKWQLARQQAIDSWGEMAPVSALLSVGPCMLMIAGQTTGACVAAGLGEVLSLCSPKHVPIKGPVKSLLDTALLGFCHIRDLAAATAADESNNDSHAAADHAHED